jgi:hypothetical protein
MVYDTRTEEKHGQRVTVWNVTFSDVSESPQDHEEALMEAIECYAQFKADACNISKHPRMT